MCGIRTPGQAGRQAPGEVSTASVAATGPPHALTHGSWDHVTEEKHTKDPEPVFTAQGACEELLSLTQNLSATRRFRRHRSRGHRRSGLSICVTGATRSRVPGSAKTARFRCREHTNHEHPCRGDAAALRLLGHGRRAVGTALLGRAGSRPPPVGRGAGGGDALATCDHPLKYVTLGKWDAVRFLPYTSPYERKNTNK